MMDAENQAQPLAAALENSLRYGISRSFPQLLQLLAEGQPLPPARIAAALGQPPEEVATLLRRLPSLEWDAAGNLVGAGISLRPTPHQFEVHGRVLYTWCALDTLFFPLLLRTTARVSSACQATGSPIRLTVTPEGLQQLDPAQAVVSLVTPAASPDIRSSFCNQVHFFRSREDAAAWLAAHPGAQVVRVPEAFELGRTLAAAAGSGQLDSLSCSPTAE